MFVQVPMNIALLRSSGLIVRWFYEQRLWRELLLSFQLQTTVAVINQRIGFQINSRLRFVLEIRVPKGEAGNLHIIENSFLIGSLGHPGKQLGAWSLSARRLGQRARKGHVSRAVDEDEILVRGRRVGKRIFSPVG